MNNEDEQKLRAMFEKLMAPHRAANPGAARMEASPQAMRAILDDLPPEELAALEAEVGSQAE